MKIKPLILSGVCALVTAFSSAHAQIIAPTFAADYSFIDLGTPLGIPGPFGGLTLLNSTGNTLLLGGSANTSGGAIYSIPITRDGGGHISGFGGVATLFASAPQIDGGLAYGPGGVLFSTTFSNNSLVQYKPGSNAPDKIIGLSALGVASSTGTVAFVPAGFPGAGEIRILSYNGGGFYSGSLTPDGLGTFDLMSVMLQVTTGFGPEGLAYVPSGSPVFTGQNALISEYLAGRVSAYGLDTLGFPIPASRQDFVTGLAGAEGAFTDSATGDFLFSTFNGGNKVIVVRGFAASIPEPGSAALLITGALACVARRRRD